MVSVLFWVRVKFILISTMEADGRISFNLEGSLPTFCAPFLSIPVFH